jgi:ABC-2 type transport system permease protein
MPDNRMPFNPEAPVVSHFEEVLFPYPTGLSQKLGAKLKLTELVRTSEERSGVIDVNKLRASDFDPLMLELERGRPTRRSYILAGWIQGEAPLPSESSATSQTGVTTGDRPTAERSVPITLTKAADQAQSSAPQDASTAGSKPPQINVIYVGDIDVLSSEFVRMRNEPNQWVARFRFDNVPFVCNLIDAVAGETRFLEIRKRKPRHSTLRMVEARAAEAREREQTEINKSRRRYEEEEKKADDEAKKVYADLQKVVDDLQAKQRRGEEVDLAELEAKVAQLQIKRAFIERQLNVTKERLKRERDQELAAIERKRDQEIQRIQNEYKIQATVFPPILPLLVGLVVWTRRRIREREGIARSRMRTV